MKTSKKKWLYRALCAALVVTLTAGTAVMTPIADFVGTNITANAATDVSNASAFLTAVENGGEIKLADDISINQNVTISKECTIDFNGKKITFGGARNDKYHLEVNAPTTLKNGTLTSSCTNDPRFYVLNVNSDAVVENMTISQPANRGAHEIVYVGLSKKLTMIDSTITYVQNGTASARAIDARGATLLFYGDNFMNTVSSGSYDWNIMQNCNCYFYSGTLEVNYHFALYSSSTKVYFCGGAVKNTRSGDGVFSGLKSADYVILNNGDDNYAIYSDEAYTNPITATQVLSATAIYSKKVNKYTVTWLDNDGTTSLGTSTVTEGNSPIYNGETTKAGENGIKYVLSGWNDGTTTYAPDALPAVTGNVTYTAVYTAYQNHDGILFAPWTSTNSLPTAAGNYYLTGNVTISGTWNAPDGINLCLNGYGIRYSGSNGCSVICLRSGYTLNIFDCDTTKEHYITLSNFRGTAVSDTGTETTVTNGTGVIKVNGGYITGGNNSGGGGGIDSDYYQSADVYIKGVTFIGNKANGAKNFGQGSAILLTIGSLSLDGTKFFYNYAQRDGGTNAETVCRWSGTTSLKDVDMQYNVGGGINITGGNSAVVSGKTIIRNNVYSTTNTKEFNASVTTLDVSGLTDGSYIGIRNGDANSAPFTTAVATDYVQYFHMDPRFTNLVVSTDSDGYGIRKATYTVTWKNGEDIIETDEKVIEGDTPTYDGEIPTKIDETDTYKYVFSGWSPDVTEVTGDAVYTAQFDKYTIIHDSDVLVNSTVTTPEILVTDPITGDILTEGTDYTLTINDDTVTVTGIGNYAGEVTKPFIKLSKDVSVDVTRKKTSTGARITLSGEWLIPEGAEILESGVARVHVSDPEGITKEYIYEHGIKKSPGIQYRNVKMAFSINLNKTAAQKKICAVTYVKYKIGDKEFTSISDVKFA